MRDCLLVISVQLYHAPRKQRVVKSNHYLSEEAYFPYNFGH